MAWSSPDFATVSLWFHDIPMTALVIASRTIEALHVDGAFGASGHSPSDGCPEFRTDRLAAGQIFKKFPKRSEATESTEAIEAPLPGPSKPGSAMVQVRLPRGTPKKEQLRWSRSAFCRPAGQK